MAELGANTTSPVLLPLHPTPKRRRSLPLRDLKPSASSAMSTSMPSEAITASTAGNRRTRTLADINPKYVSESGLCLTSEVETPRGSIRIQHLTASSALGAGGNVGGGVERSRPRFPRLDECAHFHYEFVEFGLLQFQLCDEEIKPLAVEESDSRSFCVQVSSQGKCWVVRRTYNDFRFLDRQLHRCIYDRKFSLLPELPAEENIPGSDREESARQVLSDYLSRFSNLAGNLLTCGPVLNWLELDNRGHRLIVTDDSAINTPAVAAAYAVKRYIAQASDEISFEVGDMISVIDMPPPEESVWWRGKRGFEVGFFPCECVEVIGDKVPQKLPALLPQKAPPPQPSKPVLRKHGKLIAFFRSFILSRPSRRKLKQSGILKERVFGCDLGEHLQNTGHDVPMVLKCCSEFIESHGVVDGIYRLSGITSNIQKLRNAFDEDRIPALYEDEAIRQDIHSVSSLLKMYFRELPNPLCTYHLYDQFVAAVQSNDDDKLLRMRDVVQQLPPPHYRTLEYLMRHLTRMAHRSNETGMTPKNVAIVWAPNLLRSKELEVGGVAALQGVSIQAVVTEYLVRYADLIFNDKLIAFPTQSGNSNSNSSCDTPKRSRPKSLAISTPTKLLSLEEARNRAILANNKAEQQKYIEVGGGPSTLPPKFHTVIDLPNRKRSSLKHKRSPLGWKSFFGRHRGSNSSANNSVQQAPENTMITPSGISLTEKVITESDLLHSRKASLRPVKSAESLVSTSLTLGSPKTPVDVNSPASSNNKYNSSVVSSTPVQPDRDDEADDTLSSPTVGHDSCKISPRCHNRSVSHDSYFDQFDYRGKEEEMDTDSSPLYSKVSLELSEMRLNFELEDSEMRIFSEDETLRSASVDGSESLSRSPDKYRKSPRHSKVANRRFASPSLARESISSSPAARFEASPNAKKKKAAMSPKCKNTKRSKMEALDSPTSDIQFIDAPSPETESTRNKTGVGWRNNVLDSSPECADNDDGRLAVVAEIHAKPDADTVSEEVSTDAQIRSGEMFGPITSNDSLENLDTVSVDPPNGQFGSPSETSISMAGATASENESFTLHSTAGIASGSSSAGTTPDTPMRDEPPRIDFLYTPLVSDTEPNTPDVPRDVLYENVFSGGGGGDNEAYENVRVSPEVTNEYQNVVITSEPVDSAYENVEFGQTQVPEPVYEQVKVFRRSVQEVNTLVGPSERKDLKLLLPGPPTCEPLRSPESPSSTVTSIHPSLSDLGSSFLPTEATSSDETTSLTVTTVVGFNLASPSSSLPTPTASQIDLIPDVMSSSWPKFASGDLDDSKRRVESEIGRDMLRDRRMRLELEKMREESSPVKMVPKSAPTSPEKAPSESPKVQRASMHEITWTEVAVIPKPQERLIQVVQTPEEIDLPNLEAKTEQVPPLQEVLSVGCEENTLEADYIQDESDENTSPSDETEEVILRRGPAQKDSPILKRHSEPAKSDDVTVQISQRISEPPTKSERKASVKELLSKFETGTEDDKNHPNAKPPRAPPASPPAIPKSNSTETATEDVASLRTRTSSEGNEPTDSVRPPLAPLASLVNVNDPETRQRIEKYKEERRSFLREKYRSESFKNEKDDVILRLKQKTVSPTRTTPDVPDVARVENGDEVNVRERVASWSMRRGSQGSPEITAKLAKKPPSPPAIREKRASKTEEDTSATSPRKIKDMTALFETKDCTVGSKNGKSHSIPPNDNKSLSSQYMSSV